MKKIKDLLTVSEAAKLFGLPRTTIKSRIDRKRLPYVKRGGIYFIDREDLAAWSRKKKGVL